MGQVANPAGHGGEEALVVFAEVLFALAHDAQHAAPLLQDLHGHVDLAAHAETHDDVMAVLVPTPRAARIVVKIREGSSPCG